MPTPPKGHISVEHLWKSFRADENRAMLRDHVHTIGRRLRGHRRERRWVLKDINVEIEPGRTVAIIGVNGSGKSTLLKIMSRVTYPTAGSCRVGGRIGALIEVRSGIHPDLSGRENITFYGSALGLSRKRVAEQFDEIVEFAGLTEAVDRPVKFYSSGMVVRLGFSIAAFMEPDVLLVDEVLAVGDAAFQQKCLERMNHVVEHDGATLVFVSHDLAAVEAMCDRAVWLTDAVVQADGPVREVLTQYRHAIEEDANLGTANDGPVRVVKASVAGPGGGQPVSGEPFEVRLVLDAAEAPGQARFFIGVSEGTAMPIFVVRHTGHFPEGEFELTCELKHLPLPAGHYYIWVSMLGPRARPFTAWHPVAPFDVFGPSPTKPPKGVMVLSPIHVESRFEIS